MNIRDIPEARLRQLEAIHRQVDGLVAERTAGLGNLLVCGPGCSSCCQDDLTVLEIEAALIVRRAAPVVRGQVPGPPGACAFLDSRGHCRIYQWRPYVCRTQGLPLRWLDPHADQGESRDICPLNREQLDLRQLPMGDLDEKLCWTLGPWEGRLASLNAEATGQFETRRRALRGLFSQP